MTTELRVKRGSAMPTWPTSFSEDGSDNGSSSSGSGGGMTAIPPDSMIRARTLVTTGLYLMHLMYWTVLFISSGRQVVRIVDQVRAAIGIEPSFIGGGRLEEMRQSLLEDPSHPPQEQQQQQSMLFESSGSASTSPIPSRRRRYLTSPSLSSVATSLSSAGSQDLGRNEGGRAAEGETVAVETKMTAVETEEVKEAPQAMTASNVEELASLDLGLEEWIELSQEQQAKAQAQVQALEDKAIQVAVHFESLRQRLHQFHGGHHLQNSRRSTPLSSTSTSRVNSRPNSMYFGTTTSTTSSLSTTSTHATLVAASQSAGSFPSLVSLNSGGGQDDEDSNKWKRSSMTTPVSSLSRSSSFKGGKLDAALPVSPQSSMVVSPTSTKVQGRHYRSSSHSYRPKVSTAMASAAVSSSPLTSPVAMTPLGGGNGRHRRLSPTLA
ncbi:hypothetical protein BGZ73_000404 [Actinomortierella ambigua]|nr:hypothetical protein BGZ73_000404 [Actinomortierella ambigua]